MCVNALFTTGFTWRYQNGSSLFPTGLTRWLQILWFTATKRPFSKIGQKIPYGSGRGLRRLGQQTMGGLLKNDELSPGNGVRQVRRE